MGNWGTGISSNDTFEDIKDEFFELYNEGLESTEITQKLINSNQEIVDDKEDGNNFWFALALCQWECKALEPELLERITKIIESGTDIELWKEIGAEKSELTKRRKALEKFLEKLYSEKKSPKKRKKKVFRDAIFKKGDCLSVELSNGSFGAAFVLESEGQTEYGLNLIALCNYNSDDPPTAQYFEKADVIISKQQSSGVKFEDYPLISWYMAPHFKSNEIKISVVGTLETDKTYNQKQDYRNYVHWKYIPTHIESQPELVAKHGAIQTRLTLKSLR
jgi:hypothetical protein